MLKFRLLGPREVARDGRVVERLVPALSVADRPRPPNTPIQLTSVFQLTSFLGHELELVEIRRLIERLDDTLVTPPPRGGGCPLVCTKALGSGAGPNKTVIRELQYTEVIVGIMLLLYGCTRCPPTSAKSSNKLVAFSIGSSGEGTDKSTYPPPDSTSHQPLIQRHHRLRVLPRLQPGAGGAQLLHQPRLSVLGSQAGGVSDDVCRLLDFLQL